MADMDKFLIGFLIAILGAVLVGVIASQVLLKTEYLTVSNEEEAFIANAGNESQTNITEVHTVTNYPTTWKIADCPISSVSIKNASGGTALTDDTDYTLTESSGTWVFIRTDTTDALVGLENSTFVDYSYCGNDYLNSSWGRNTLKLAPGFFVLLILLGIIALLYTFLRVYKKD